MPYLLWPKRRGRWLTTSSLMRAPLPADAVYFGEVSLSGAVRPVAQAAARLKEAQKLGFVRAIVPEAAHGEAADPDFARTAVGTLTALVADIAARAEPSRRQAVAGDSSGDREDG